MSMAFSNHVLDPMFLLSRLIVCIDKLLVKEGRGGHKNSQQNCIICTKLTSSSSFVPCLSHAFTSALHPDRAALCSEVHELRAKPYSRSPAAVPTKSHSSGQPSSHRPTSPPHPQTRPAQTSPRPRPRLHPLTTTPNNRLKTNLKMPDVSAPIVTFSSWRVQRLAFGSAPASNSAIC